MTYRSHRVDLERGDINYEIWDERPESYRLVALIREDFNSSALADAAKIVGLLNAALPTEPKAPTLMELACASLQKHLFTNPHPQYPEGFIGMGKDKIHVYVHAKENRWRGPRPEIWEFLPVEYHFGVGQITAGPAR